jgi:hypothetical protein
VIQVENPDRVEHGVASATVDGAVVAARPVRVALVDGAGNHRIVVRMGVVSAVPAHVGG